MNDKTAVFGVLALVWCGVAIFLLLNPICDECEQDPCPATGAYVTGAFQPWGYNGAVGGWTFLDKGSLDYDEERGEYPGFFTLEEWDAEWERIRKESELEEQDHSGDLFDGDLRI